MEEKTMGTSVLLVITRCTDPAREAEFNTWYDDVHLPDVLTVPHIVAAQRYKLSGPPNKNEPDAQYLAVYELDTDDTRSAMKALGEHMPQWSAAGRVIDCMQVVSGTTFAAIGSRQREKASAAGD
jgi:hypothetical protein